MRIGGLQKLTLIDYPGKIAAIIFTQGCNWRCGYCHNPELVLSAKYEDLIPEDAVLEFLMKRKGQLEGVVISGGEPTIQADISSFLAKIKALDYSVKLDTNGSNPAVLKNILELNLVDYVAMDIKACPSHYSQAVGKKMDMKPITESIACILDSGLPYQFRTTLVKPVCPLGDLKELFSLIAEANHYVLQEFIPSQKIIDQSLLDQPHYTRPEIDALRLKFEKIPPDLALYYL